MSTIRSLENYTLGRWMPGEEAGTVLRHAITAEPIAIASSKGIDFEAVLNYGRQVGGTRLRKLTFQQRGRMLKALALHLMEKKDYFYELSKATGATKADSWVWPFISMRLIFRFGACLKKLL